ncbi:hypothetical protein EDB80DRAFT_561220 [Ilyonectria destructans]|nr:hypothetical protein EDB80DRAFT_561220 [Ilyonectria destructans]
MHFTTAALSALLASAALATPLSSRGYHDSDGDIFPGSDGYEEWAICKNKITKWRFPNLQAPNNKGGCVRYYQGIDMTGVVTEQHFFFKDGFKNACDCAAKCLEEPNKCTNWVWKHTFMAGDGGKRSCTLYSSPNLPTEVTLKYDLANSKGFNLLQATNNPQAGAPAPLTFLDAAGTIPDKFGVSGFMVQDQNGRQFC